MAKSKTNKKDAEIKEPEVQTLKQNDSSKTDKERLMPHNLISELNSIRDAIKDILKKLELK
jgi:hypothetical protein